MDKVLSAAQQVRLRPTHKAIQAYYRALQESGAHDVGHETALRSAFQNRLAETAQTHRWLLGKREVLRSDLSVPQNLADLLNQFYAYTGPEHEDFDKAVEEFQGRVPDLARGQELSLLT